ncbi:MAG: alpha/beta fold hydrolase [Acidimicrobiia bacterium]
MTAIDAVPSPSPLDSASPPIVWKRTFVDDRAAGYAVAGRDDGLPVLLLHGWALGHNAYRGAIERLVRTGCRVLAPALPGFGGTPELAPAAADLEGYARWVDGFCAAMGLVEPLVVVGHSFGGGVAIRLAHDHPERVRRLVLVNSIGGASWNAGSRVRSLAERPLWDWGLHMQADIWPLRQATKVLPVILADAVPNLLRNPRGLARVGAIARKADLRAELVALRERHVPITVIWGRRDGVIPRESFDAMCTAVGATGTVVEGGHAWLLANPDDFLEVITNDLEVAKTARAVERQPRLRGRARRQQQSDI